MTLRQVLEIIQRRWLLVALTTLVVLGSAAAYLQLTPEVYKSSSVVRYSLTATRMFDGGSGYADTDLDLDPDFLTSPALIEIASPLTKDEPSALQAAIDTTLVEGVRSNRLEIVAIASSAEQAQLRAQVVAQVYVDHLAAQVKATQERLQTELTEAKAERTEAVRQATKKPNDPVARQRLETALGNVSIIEDGLVSIANSGPPASILQSALPGDRTGTDALTVLLIGLASGLLAGAGIALIRDLFDDRLRGAVAADDDLGIPVLAELTRIPRRHRYDRTLPTTTTRSAPFHEGIRALRTSLNVLYPEPHSAIAITSAEPGDGKSFITANLAVSMARGGRSVIVVGADLRRPTLDHYFGLAPTRGIADAIVDGLDAASLEKLLQPTAYERLRVLSAGIARREPADLLAADAFKLVVRQLRQFADVVIFDTPPGLALADAAVIGAQVDGTVVVAAAKSTTHRRLAETVRILAGNGVEIAGAVVNRSHKRATRAYTHYYGTTHPEDDFDQDPLDVASLEAPTPPTWKPSQQPESADASPATPPASPRSPEPDQNPDAAQGSPAPGRIPGRAKPAARPGT